MSKCHFRVKCVPVDTSADAYTYVFDLAFMDDGLVKGRTYLGFCKAINPGTKKATETYPLILSQDGEMDFGSGFDDDARYLKTNILNKSIKLGETFTVWDEGEVVYRIVEMHAI